MTKNTSLHTSTQDSFKFSEEQLKEIDVLIKRYPEDRRQSALLPLLWMAQRRNKGWLSRPALEEVARILKLPVMRVYEVASFYTMFRLKPVSKHFIQICRTTSCYLRGSDKLLEVCANFLKLDPGETSENKLFTVEEVECLGACANAPVVQINDDYFEDLTPKNFQGILEKLAHYVQVTPGSQADRIASKAVLPKYETEGSEHDA